MSDLLKPDEDASLQATTAQMLAAGTKQPPPPPTKTSWDDPPDSLISPLPRMLPSIAAASPSRTPTDSDSKLPAFTQLTMLQAPAPAPALSAGSLPNGSASSSTSNVLATTPTPVSVVAPTSPSPTATASTLVLFLNIVVLDTTQLAKNKVQDKIDKTNMPGSFKDAAKRIGAKAASKLTTPSTVAVKMGPKIPEQMPAKMAEKGLIVKAETVFQEGPYLVVQLKVQKIDRVMMVEIRALELQELRKQQQQQEWSEVWISLLIAILVWFVELLGGQSHLKSVVEELLPRVIQTKMESIMEDMLKIRIEEEMKIDAETTVLGEDKQAQFFYQKLKEIRQAAKKGT